MKTATNLVKAALCWVTTLGALATQTVTTPPNPTHSSTPAAHSGSMILGAGGDFGIFHSIGTGITADQTNGGITHLFRHDLPTGATRLLTRSSIDQQLANGSSVGLALSGNSRYLLVLSDATNLTTNTVSGNNNLLRFDLETASWQLVNHDLGVASASGRVDLGQISADGRFVLFTSQSQLLAPSPAIGSTNSLYLADMDTGSITLESAFDSDFDYVTEFALAPDGRNAVYIASPTAANTRPHLVLRNLQTHTSERVAQTTLTLVNLRIPATSRDGRYYFVAEQGKSGAYYSFNLSRAEFGQVATTNTTLLTSTTSFSALVDGPMIATDDGSRLFLANTKSLSYWDASTGTNLVQVSMPDTNGSPASVWPIAISGNGNRLLYGSTVDTNGTLQPNAHLYLTDVTNGQTTLITHLQPGEMRGEPFGTAMMDPSAQHIYFDSPQPDYAANDRNSSSDIFAYDVTTADFSLLTPKIAGSAEPRLPGFTLLPAKAISEDGSYAIFLTSSASLLEPFQATNTSLIGQSLVTGQRELLSVNTNGTPAAQAPIVDVVLSRNGKSVLMVTRATDMTSKFATNGSHQLILRDIPNKTNHLASADPRYLSPINNVLISNYALSPDGQSVVYSTSANPTPFLYDLLTDTADPAVLNIQGTIDKVTVNGWALSPNGQSLAFTSASTNLTATGPSDRLLHLYIMDLAAGTNRWIPSLVDTLALPATARAYFVPLDFSEDSTLLILSGNTAIDIISGAVIATLTNSQDLIVSRDRQYAAYRRSVSIGAPFLTSSRQVYLAHLPTGETRLVTHAFDQPDLPSQGSSTTPIISADGAWLTFSSTATNLLGSNSSAFPQAYLYNISTDQLTLVSASSNDINGANEPSGSIRMAFSSPTLLFTSAATDLAAQGEPSSLTDLYQTQLPNGPLATRDSDADGLPDWWENRYLGTLAKQPWETSLAGVSLQQAYEQSVGITTHLWINSTYNPSSGELQITFPSVVGKSYRLETTSDLSNPVWPTSTFPLAATATTATFTQNPRMDGQSQGPMFFRVVQAP